MRKLIVTPYHTKTQYLMGAAHNTKEFRSRRFIVLFVYDDKCFFDTSHAKATHVHHLDHINTNNSYLNLIPLCPACHRLIHKMPSLPPLKLSFFISQFQKRLNHLNSSL